MKPDTDTAAIAARFEESARAFTPINKVRFAKLHPFRAGITQLRQKGASYETIRDLLASAGVTVSEDTLGQFVRTVIEERPPASAPARARPPHRQRTRHPTRDTPANQAANRPANELANELANEPANEPANELVRPPFTVAPPTPDESVTAPRTSKAK